MPRTATLAALVALLPFHSLFAQPQNDLCTGAQTLTLAATGCPGTGVAGTTVGAGAEVAAPSCDDDNGGPFQDVWFTFSTDGFEPPFTLNIVPGTIGHWGVQVHVGGCGGVMVGCFPGSAQAMDLGALVANTSYAVRVFTNTSLGAAGDFTICVTGTEAFNICGTMIHDAGGPSANYPGGILPYNVTTTYCPPGPGTAVHLSFTLFTTLANDFLRVYNGPDVNAPLLGAFSGNLNNNLPGPFVSTHPSGCLTLRFSYGSFLFSAAGWTAMVTCCQQPAIALAPTSNSPVCIGGTLELQANPNLGTNVQWTGPGGFTSTALNPTLPDFSQANVGTYTVFGLGDGSGCTSSPTSIVVTSILPPVSVTATSDPTFVCGNGTVDLSSTAVTTSEALVESFETFPAAGWGTSGTGVTAATNTTYHAHGTRSVRLSHVEDAAGQYGMTTNVNLALVPDPKLHFKHICALEQGYDFGFVEYSINGGSSWAQFPAASYLGTGHSQFNPNARFSRDSYLVWQDQFTGSGSTPGAGPATALWQEEVFDLAQWATATQFRVRFRITADGSIDYYGWLLDHVRILGDVPGLGFAWTSDPAGFSSTVQSPQDVPVAATTTFTVTASTAPGCGTSASVTVQQVGPVPSVTGATTICAGQPLDLFAVVSGGTPPNNLVWTVNGQVVSTGPALFGPTLAANGTVELTVTDNSGCQTITTLPITVNPLPTVTLASFSPVCVYNAPFALSGGAPAGGTYSINGTPATIFDPSAGVGTYVITYSYTDANGCTATANRNLIVDPCTGVEEVAASGLRLFPNPANDVLNIELPAGIPWVRVLDATGRAVLQGRHSGQPVLVQLPLTACAPGPHVVEVGTVTGGVLRARIVVAR